MFHQILRRRCFLFFFVGVLLFLLLGSSLRREHLFLPGEQIIYTIGETSFFMRLCPPATFPAGLTNVLHQEEEGEEKETLPNIGIVKEYFFMAETPVTYELWSIVYQWGLENGYIFTNPGQEGSHGEIGVEPTDSRREPVTSVNWYDSIIWCNALSEYLGYEPVYTSFGEILRDATDWDTLDNAVMKPRKGFRLPSSDEWELAARYIGPYKPKGEPLHSEAIFMDSLYWIPENYASGAKGPAWIGFWHDGRFGDQDATKEAAWYIDFHGGNTTKTQDVGQKPPSGNYLGLFDMSGNVWEWCFNWHPSSEGISRVLRGGGFSNDPYALQVGYLIDSTPNYGDNFLGFRIVRGIE